MDTQPEPRRDASGRRARAQQLRMHPLSYAAIAAAIVAGPAFGTGFQANYSVASGGASISRTGTADTIDLTNSSSAVIDWSPYDSANSSAPITFLPAGNTATFQSTSGNFTVLNRVLASDPGRPIEFDGHVVSRFYANSGPFHQGGNVWFYAPGGIILGSGAVFDVGSLLLTTNAITLGANNALPNIATGISVRGSTDSEALIDIRGGARINADVLGGSYVAVVAPRIQQNGAVRVYGSAGYIAAEQADFTISNGLFNISYAVGSHVDQPGDTTLQHAGSTGGPAQTPTGNPQRIYLVAVPKNDAITMLVDGAIGYDAAASASQENGVVVLAAGGIRTAENATYQQFGTPDADLQIGGSELTSLTSRLIGTASGTLAMTSGSIGLTTTRAVDLFGLQQVSLSSGGADLAIGGATTLYSQFAGVDVAVGSATMMTLNGDISLGAAGTLANGTITGGTLAFDVQGTGVVHGALSMVADGSQLSSNANGVGGAAMLAVHGAGSRLTIDGTTTVTANGIGDDGSAGYAATGGTVTLAAYDGGRLTATGITRLEANGTGGGGEDGAGGAGTGGMVQLTTGDATAPGVASHAGTIAFTGGATATADGTGGGGSDGMTGGFGQGGTARVDAYAGSAAGIVSLDATGTGGDGDDSGAAGGGGKGGTAAINADGGNVSLMPSSITSTALIAYGFGGNGGSGATAGAGGTGTGGTATLNVDGATVDGPAGTSFALFANGQGGQGGNGSAGAGGAGGAAIGGTSNVTLTSGIVNVAAGMSSNFNATAEAGVGGDGDTAGAEGSATAGHTTIAASGNSQLSQQGSVGGYAAALVGAGGAATAGTVDLSLGSAPTDMVRVGAVTLSAADIHMRQSGGVPASLAGTGGTINIAKNGGSVTLAGLTATTGHYALQTGEGDTSYVAVDNPAVTGGGVDLTLADGSPLAITGNALITHTAAVTIGAVGAGGLAVGGTIGIDHATGITITHESPAGDTIRAGAVYLATPGAIAAAGTTIRAAATEDGTITMTAGTTLVAGDLAAGSDIELAAPGGITTGAITSADTIKLTATAGAIATGALGAGAGGSNGDAEFAGNIAVGANGAVTLASATAYGDLAILSQTAGTTITGAAGAGGDAVIFSGGPVVLQGVTSGGLFYIGAPTAVNTLFGASYMLGQATDPTPNVPALIAAGVTRAGGGVSATGTIAAGRLMIGATGDIAIAGATVNGATDLDAAGAIDAQGLAIAGALTASGSSVALAGPGALTVTRATVTGTTGTLSLTAGTALTAGDLAAPGGIMLAAGTTLAAGKLAAHGSIAAASTAGTARLGDVESVGGIVRLTAGTDLTTGNVRAAGSIFLTGGGAITAGDLTAGTGPLLPGMQNSSGGSGPPGPAGIAGGFDDGAVQRCDDCYSGEQDGSSISLPFAINYFGATYRNAYVSNNGYLTFNSGSGDFTPEGLGAGYGGQPIIAPFFADVDTSNPASAQAIYGTGTFAGHRAFAATWNGVGYYDAHADKLNRFQVILTDRSDTGAGNFDVYYNYAGIQWETGEADGGSGGLGGTSAAVGYNAGTGNQPGTFYELPGSRVPGSFLDTGTAPLIAGTNDGVAGQLLFSVRNGQVSAGAAEQATVHVTNTASAGNTAAIRLGNLSGEAVDVHGAGQVTIGNSATGDRGSGTTPAGLSFATVLDASGGLITGDISGAGFIALGGGASGDVSTGSITGTSSVAVLTGGAVELGTVATGPGDTLFVSAPSVAQQGGALAGFSFTTLLTGKTFDPATLATASPAAIGGALTLGGPVTAGNVIAAARAIDTGKITAGGKIALRADGLLTIGGAVTGADIALTSSDIAIAGDASVGGQGTTSLRFASIAEGGAFVGDGSGATQGGYTLDGGELARVQAAAITIDGGSGLTLGDVALHGDTGLAAGTGANILGANGTLAFTTTGALQLVGKLAVSNLSATNRVTLAAGTQLGGILPAAGIALADGAGGLAGALTLSADRIAFTTQSAADALAAATTIAQRSDRLGANDGNVNPDGYVRAGDITVDVATTLYAQNSGPDASLASRAGFTAGAGGYHFTSHGVDPDTGLVEVVFNGRQQTATGTVTGTDLYALIDIDPQSAAATPGSTVNGCIIGDRCGTAPATPPIELFPPVQDIVASVIDGSTGPFTRLAPVALAFQNIPLVSFGDFTPSGSIPLIDEPVTGAGNEDLWGAIGFGRDSGEPDKDKDKYKNGKPARPTS